MGNAVLIGAGLSKSIVGFPVFRDLLQYIEKQSDESRQQKRLIERISEYNREYDQTVVFDKFLVRRSNAITRRSIVSVYMNLIDRIFSETLSECEPDFILEEDSNVLLSFLRKSDLAIITTNYDPLLHLSVWIRIYEEVRDLVISSSSDLNSLDIEKLTSSIEEEMLRTGGNLLHLPDMVMNLINNNLRRLSDEFYEKFTQITRQADSDILSYEKFFEIDNMQNRIFYLHGHCFKNQSMYKVAGTYATAENEIDDGPSELIGEINRGRVYRKFNAQFRDTTFDKFSIIGMSAPVAEHVLLDNLECSAKKVLMGYHCDDEIERYENLKSKLLSTQRFRAVELLQTAHLIDELSIH